MRVNIMIILDTHDGSCVWVAQVLCLPSSAVSLDWRDTLLRQGTKKMRKKLFLSFWSTSTKCGSVLSAIRYDWHHRIAWYAGLDIDNRKW